MTSKINITDLQFNGDDQNAQLLRRLMDDLRKLGRAYNQLVDQVSELASTGVSTTAVHVLATSTSLGADHTVSGLEASSVLIASAADQALFRRLRWNDIDTNDFQVTELQDGDVMRYRDGYWVFESLPGLISLADPGGDALMGFDGTSDHYVWRTAGLGIGMNSGSLFVVPNEIPHSGLQGLGGDDHSQYTAHEQNETVEGAWTFQGAQTFESTTLFQDDRLLTGLTDYHTAEQPEAIWTDTDSEIDEGSWKWVVQSGALLGYSLSDDDGEGESWLRVTRIEELIDEMAFSGNRLSFNGADVANDTDDFTISGQWTFVQLLTAPSLLLRTAQPALQMADTDADSDEYPWLLEQSADRVRLSALNADGDVAETALDIQAVDGVIQAIDFQGDRLNVNGSEVLANEGYSSTATAGVATLPATPVGFIAVTLDGSPYKIPYYAP